MSNPFRVSEIVEVELKPDVDLSSPEMAKHQNDALDTISSQPGCTSIHYGPSIEHKDKMVMVIEWAQMDDHTTFTQTPQYASFAAHLHTHVITAITSMTHVRAPFPAGAPAALAAPATELLTLGYGAGVARADVEARVAQFAEALREHAAGFVALAGGWAVEESEVGGEMGPVYEIAIGWESVEAHLAFRETHAFREALPLVVGLSRERRMHHVKFARFEM